MNLRQKAKRYKNLYEQTLTHTVQEHIVKTEYPIVHFRNVSHLDPYIEDPGQVIEYGQNRLLDQIKPLIVSQQIENDFGLAIQSDIWIVDRRQNDRSRMDR